MQDYLVLDIAEVNFRHAHIALERSICDSACAVRVLPRPHSGMLLSLGDLAVRVDLCVDEGNVAVIDFGLLVYKLKYALCPGECHDNEVELLNYLVYRHCEAAGQLEECRDVSEQQPAYMVYCKHAAEHSDKCVLQMTEVVVYRS